MSLDRLHLDYKSVAQKYGGNKKLIAQAAATGALGEYGALVAAAAADFIDTMRAGAQAEMAPQQTVYEKLFSPPQTPAGLGATPEAAPLMASNPQMPPAALQGGLGAAPQAPAMMAAPEQAMLAEGGVASLPIPDDMFVESDNYSGGGLVAFARGSDEDGIQADNEEEKNLLEQIIAEQAAAAQAQAAPQKAAPLLPNAFYGFSATDPMANISVYEKLYGTPETKYSDMFEKELLEKAGPEYAKKRLNEAKWMTLGKIGSVMASTPGSFLQAVSTGIGAALPGAEESAKELRAEQREIRRGLMDLEAGRNTVAAQKAARLLDMQQMAVRGMEAQADRTARATEGAADRASAERIARIREQGDAARAAAADAKDKVNVGTDNFVVKNKKPNQPDTVIQRLRVQERGGKQYGYMFPQLGDAILRPSYGSYAVGVNNAMKFAQDKGLRIAVSDKGELQFVGSNNKARTISPKRMREFDNFGVDFNPADYALNLKPLSEENTSTSSSD